MTRTGYATDLLAGKTVVITGAGRGIGLEVATAMRDCGATIIAHSGRTGTAKNLNGIAETTFEADLTSAEETQAFVDFVRDQTDTIDVLVNNAGTMMGRIPADELTEEQYQALVNLNQSAVVRVTKGLIPALRQPTSAAIINTVSISALTGGSAGSSIYSATKAFVSTYTKALARELAPDNIRANAISPGTITTDFHDRYSTQDKLEKTRLSVPLQRLGTPQDCAPAYIFLASETLSGYMTGQVLEINGGQLIC